MYIYIQRILCIELGSGQGRRGGRYRWIDINRKKER